MIDVSLSHCAGVTLVASLATRRTSQSIMIQTLITAFVLPLFP